MGNICSFCVLYYGRFIQVWKNVAPRKTSSNVSPMRLRQGFSSIFVGGTSVFFMFLFLLTGCSGIKTDNGTYTIAVMLPLGGEDSFPASEVLRGMEIARNEINLFGGVLGVKIDLVVCDMSAKDFDFVGTFNALRRSGVKVFNIGFDKDAILRHKMIAGCDDIFVNYLCNYPPITIGSKNSTRIFLNSAQQGDVMASAIDASQTGERQLVIMSEDNFYGKSSADYLSFCLGGERTKIYRDVFGTSERNFDVFSDQVERLRAGFVYYIGNGSSLPNFVLSMAKSGYDKVVVANCGFFNLNFIPPKSLKLLRVETLFQQGGVNGEISKRFVESYKKKYGEDASWMAACGYDSIVLLSRAASKQKLNPASMRDFFSGLKYEGAMGIIAFDHTADTTMQIGLAHSK